MIELNNLSYRISVKKADGWQRYDRARLGISVGKEQHEGEKLCAALIWATQRFDHVEVRVSDTLQRYNFFGVPNNNWEMARKAGDDWLIRNDPILKLFPKIFLYRWDDVLFDRDIESHKKIVDVKMKDPLFQMAFEKDITTHAMRTGKNIDICYAFAQEELAVFSLLQEKRPAADIYPGTYLRCRRFLRDDFSLVRIDFDRRKTPIQISRIAA